MSASPSTSRDRVFKVLDRTMVNGNGTGELKVPPVRGVRSGILNPSRARALLQEQQTGQNEQNEKKNEKHQNYARGHKKSSKTAHGFQKSFSAGVSDTTTDRSTHSSDNEPDSSDGEATDISALISTVLHRNSSLGNQKLIFHQGKSASARKQPGPLNHHIILPKGRVGRASRSVRERTKHPRLVGADLYVSRLVSFPKSPPKAAPGEESREDAFLPTTSSLPAPALCPTLTGSLHDELTCKERRPASTPPAIDTEDAGRFGRRAVGDSRPCYRCISYMHSVGIKRVFWTGKDGDWQGAKIRDLVDVLDGSSSLGDEAKAALGGIFVTKHEVLLLRRNLG